MLNKELSAKDYKETMQNVWKIVRGYCHDDEEAKNVITGAVENYLYDLQNGASEYRAVQAAMDELYIEPDYMMEFAQGIISLNVEPAWDDDEDCNDVENWVDEYAGFMGLDQHIPFVRI